MIKRIYWWTVYFVLSTMALVLLIRAVPAHAQDFFGWGGGAAEMVCTIDGDVVDCPGGPPTGGETFGNKLIHWGGFGLFLIFAAIIRAPFIRALSVPHRDAADLAEAEIKRKLSAKVAPNRVLTEGEHRVLAAMIWKDAISYAAILLGGAWVMVAL
ncbi:MAG: hypothetical protein OXC91_00860 [Rhodobacteraceae bacterium]|nr:hypothetical protein [Paracoccaceae bacterium]